MEKWMNVFVYGSLRQGEQNHFMVQQYRCIAKEVWVYGKLYDAGAGYPFLTLDQEKKVVGEIYEVPVEKIKELDDFEEYVPGAIDNIYERMLIEVYGENSKWHAYIYICNREQMLVEEIEHGDWKLVGSSKKF